MSLIIGAKRILIALAKVTLRESVFDVCRACLPLMKLDKDCVEPAVFGKIERIKGPDWRMRRRPGSPVRMRFDGVRQLERGVQVLLD